MLALHRTRFRPHALSSIRCHPRHGPVPRRTFMQGLCDGFLDLAIALPIPPSLPPYATTIILTTVAARVLLLPVAIWVIQGCFYSLHRANVL
jgi:inner membrane protein COX18